MGVSKAAGDAMSLRNNLLRFAEPDEALRSYHRERKPIADQIVSHGRRLGAFLSEL